MGSKILDPNQSKEQIASYFEQLYQAREADENNKTLTENITTQVKEWELDYQHNKPQTPITENELNQAIKKLKPAESCGPDEIPNEAFIKATHSTRLIYL